MNYGEQLIHRREDNKLQSKINQLPKITTKDKRKEEKPTI
jgi:hypothetical protein